MIKTKTSKIKKKCVHCNRTAKARPSKEVGRQVCYLHKDL